MIYNLTLHVNTPMNIHSVTLLKKEKLTSNVFGLHFSKPEGFTYEAGQFVQFLVPDGEKTAPRAYSLCSIPEQEDLQFCVKVLPDGKASAMFTSMNEGDMVDIRGPLGHFTPVPDTIGHYVATGVGMAPVMGLIRHELEYAGNKKQQHLIFGVRFKEDLFWLEKLEALAQAHDNFQYELALSKPEDDWDGLKGRVTEHICTHHDSSHHYLCGSAAMVKDAKNLLLEAGYPKEQIHFEIF